MMLIVIIIIIIIIIITKLIIIILIIIRSTKRYLEFTEFSSTKDLYQHIGCFYCIFVSWFNRKYILQYWRYCFVFIIEHKSECLEDVDKLGDKLSQLSFLQAEV